MPTRTIEFRTLDDGDKLQDGNVNAYYLDDLKLRVSVARVGAKLFAFDDLYEGAPLSGGLLTGTTHHVPVRWVAIRRHQRRRPARPGREPLELYEVREEDGKIKLLI